MGRVNLARSRGDAEMSRQRARAWGERDASNVSRLMSPRQCVCVGRDAVLFSDTFLMVCND